MNKTHSYIGITFKLAWRNLWRNHRRTLVMLSAIILGAWAMIFMTAFLRGMVQDMLDRGLDQLPGHIQIHHPLYLDDPSVVNRINEPNQELSTLLSQDFIRHWYGRIKVPAMIASEQETHGVQLIGFDPQKEQEAFSTLTITQGRQLKDKEDSGLVIGKKLAEKLETGLGKRVVVMSQNPDNDIAERGFRIVGIYEAVVDEQEKVMIFTGLTPSQTLLAIPNQITELALFIDQAENAQQHAASLQAQLPQEYDAQPWQSLNRLLSASVSYMDGFVMIWIIVVFLAMSFGLVNTLIMAIFERVREIGLMLALGMQGPVIMLQIVFETLLLLIIGLGIGSAAAIGSIMALQDGIDLSSMAEAMAMAGVGTLLRPELVWNDVLTANGTVLILGLGASLIPAWRASKYNPITALNKTG